MKGGMMRLVPWPARRQQPAQEPAAADATPAAPEPGNPGNPYPLSAPAGPAVERALRDTGAMDMSRVRRVAVFHAHPAPPTRPQQALTDEAEVALVRPYMPTGHPLDPRTPVEPAASGVIEDSLPGPAEPAPAAAPANFLSDPVLYSGPGWAGLLMRLRLQNGEWENVHLIAERGWAENAADEAAQHFRARLGIARRARQLCADLGSPELATVILGRMRELEASAGGAA